MGSYWDHQREHWRYQFKHKGIRYTGRGYSKKKDSEEAEAEERKKVKANPGTKKTHLVCSDYVAQYLLFAKRKFVKDVFNRKFKALNGLIASQDDLPLEQYFPINIHNYLNTLPTNGSYNEYRKEISSFFAWCKKMDPYTFQFLINPCLAIDQMAVDESEAPIPTVKEVMKIIAAARPGDELDTVLCCLHLLARIDEILRMRWKDVNFEKRTVTLWTRKRKDGKYESDQMPMNQVVYDILKARWERRTQDKWVYFNIKTGTRFYHRPRMMASICRRAGIKPIGTGRMKLWRGKDIGKVVEIPLYYGFHSFRHFMASYLSDVEKISAKKTQGLLRHKNLTTTEVYVHLVDPAQIVIMEKVGNIFMPKINNQIGMEEKVHP